MEKRQMSDFVSFVAGVNPTRAKRQYGSNIFHYYDQEAFEKDYSFEADLVSKKTVDDVSDKLSLRQGDVIISNSLQKAAIVSASNEGKVPTLNFIKVEFKGDKLDKLYFLYLFNSYSEVQRQKERDLQGASILRLSVKLLNQLMIPVVDLEEQIKIGEAYSETLRLKTYLKRYAVLTETIVSQVIEESIKER
ncbi:restriction endonuclease subunit S [Streptococcus halotolerans]